MFDLEKFWKQEELFDPNAVLLNPDEQDCEEFFVNTHSRDPSGRYIVRLPFKISNAHDLKFNGSFNIAVNILHRNESRFSKDGIFQKSCIDFMRNYKDTGHMLVSKFVDLLTSSWLCEETWYKSKISIGLQWFC